VLKLAINLKKCGKMKKKIGEILFKIAYREIMSLDLKGKLYPHTHIG
jgi:hypothetical protein